jgi:23S rRNA (uracil1939-C5)-methyltransferase
VSRKRSALRPGQALEVTIEKPVYRGLGLARHEGEVVFVPRAVPGDRLRVRVQSVRKGFTRAIAEEILAAGPFRRDPPCAHFATCGGCAYQGYDYDAQLRLKEAVLHDALSRTGVPYREVTAPVVPSPERAWRTRAHLHFEDAADGVRVGFHQEGSRRVVPIAGCLQLSEAMNRTAQALRTALTGSPSLRGRVEGVELAESFAGDALVAALVTGLDPVETESFVRLRESVPWATGFGALVGEGRRPTYRPLGGDPHVEAMVEGLALRAHVRAFFQGNRFLTGPLVRAVLDTLTPGVPVLDLYAGVGLFALPAARSAREVQAVEINPAAIEDGRYNAARARLGNVTFHESDVTRALQALPRADGEQVILDPPRSGAGTDVVGLLAARAPFRITYVSCDPPTLARDLGALGAAGYVVRRLQPFDLFPDTFHLETLAFLTRG